MVQHKFTGDNSIYAGYSAIYQVDSPMAFIT